MAEKWNSLVCPISGEARRFQSTALRYSAAVLNGPLTVAAAEAGAHMLYAWHIVRPPILQDFPESFEMERLLIRSPLPGDGPEISPRGDSRNGWTQRGSRYQVSSLFC